ncbi:hypothetical protein C1645_135317 [Glomus cerebriforme]|uniref:Protein kinase domain-containing protein n=1 Tax=Glomus cerebriforme TaxID=658196 RepID=A0A397T7G4_9GLOM|nr:hypothetical protein C1645_135317 [Glomus cerebriforme]
MIIMEYAVDGSLRNNIHEISQYKLVDKLFLLKNIIIGLDTIHESNNVHRDLHDGNILSFGHSGTSISDFQPVDYFYMAPEILRVNLILQLVICGNLHQEFHHLMMKHMILN